MNVAIVSLVALFVVGGLFYFFFWDRIFNRSRKDDDSSVSVPVASIVNVRSAGSKKIVVELDLDYIPNAETLPFDPALEALESEERTIIEIFRDPNTPLSEKKRIYDELVSNGYEVKNPEDASQNTVRDFSDVDDLNVLHSYLKDSSFSEAEKKAVRNRISTLLGMPVGRESDSKGGGDSSSSEASESDDDYDAAEGFVDNDSLESVETDAEYEPVPEVPEPEAQPASDEASEEPVRTEVKEGKEEELPQDPDVPESDGDVLVIEFDKELDDAVDSTKSIELMTFIAKSFRNGLIRPDLVEFAEQKLHLNVVEGLWDKEKKAEARRLRKERAELYVPMEMMNVDEFDTNIRQMVHDEEVRHEKFARNAAAVAAETVKDVVDESRSDKEEERVSVYPLQRGGLHDIAMDRLRTYGSGLN